MKTIDGNEYVSLYEYFKRAQGPEVGRAVARYANATQQPVITQYVDNRSYQGEVRLYNRQFLHHYFNQLSALKRYNDPINRIQEDFEDDVLPF